MVWPGVLDFSRHRTMLDSGGGSGAHLVGAALKWPDLRSIVLDFSQVCEVAEGYIVKYGLQDRIKTCDANIWCDHWPAEKCHFLTAKSFDALTCGGRIVIHEMLCNDEKTGPFAPAAFGMMMGWTEGKQYSGRNYLLCCKRSALKRFKFIRRLVITVSLPDENPRNA